MVASSVYTSFTGYVAGEHVTDLNVKGQNILSIHPIIWNNIQPYFHLYFKNVDNFIFKEEDKYLVGFLMFFRFFSLEIEVTLKANQKRWQK